MLFRFRALINADERLRPFKVGAANCDLAEPIYDGSGARALHFARCDAYAASSRISVLQLERKFFSKRPLARCCCWAIGWMAMRDEGK
jgi:hypothetical protein